jgi:DNA-directed RNA polymerase subunit RPC12/RpoP
MTQLTDNLYAVETDYKWVCNECNAPNFTSSVSEEDIENEVLACINCGGFEFHKVSIPSLPPKD